MVLAWDENKNRINRRKHGVSFETAAWIFEDPNVVSYLDRVVDQEERWHSIGCAGDIAILLVVHTNEAQPSEAKMVKKKSGSSRQERRVLASALFTTPITEKQRRELKRLAGVPDSQIDFSDAPEGKPRKSDLQVGRFYRPIKQLVSLRVSLTSQDVRFE
jgi:uncharacterized protein